MRHINLFFLLLIAGSSLLKGQVLTTEDAVKMTLANNYDILVAKGQVQQALNNTGKFNQGMLPTASANAGGQYNLSSATVEKQDGNEFTVNNIASNSLNAGVGVNYVIYAGKSRLYNIEKFKTIYQRSDLEVRSLIERTLLQVYNQYYQIAQLQQNSENIAASLSISNRRLTRAKYGQEYGQNTRLEVLNATVDIDNDSISYVNIQQQLANAKRSMNLLLGRDIDTAFEIDTTVLFAEDLLLSQLLKDGQLKNVNLLAAQKNIDLNDLDLKLNHSQKLPTVSTFAQYGWNYLNSGPTSLFAKQNSLGLNLGISAQYTIFDGGRRRVNEQNIKVAREMNKTQLYKLEQSLERDIKNAWQAYQNALFVLNAQQNNVKTSQLNFDYTKDRFEAGQVSSILFRQAQLNLLFAKNNLNQAKYNAKLTEITLLQLSGNLL